MSKKTIIKRLGALLCTMGVLCWTSVLFLINSSAADGIINLTLDCHTLWGDIVPDEEWSIYKVAELQSDGTCRLYGDFAHYPVSFDDFSASALTDAATTLENYVVLDGVAPYESGISDVNGDVVFSNIPDGIYLMLGKPVDIGDLTYSAVPFIVSVNYEGDGETMELLAYAKYTVMSTSNYGRYSVVKKFGNKAAEPQESDAFVTAEIYCDGNLYDTVQLNAANKWRYSWQSDDYHDWRVKEINVPSDCYVNYSRAGATLTIVNTKTNVLPDEVTNTGTVTSTTETTTTAFSDTTTEISSVTMTSTSDSSSTDSDKSTTTATAVSDNATDTTATSSSTDSTANDNKKVTTTSNNNNNSSSNNSVTKVTNNEKLPQTGQLWWPIPILVISGMLFLFVGLAMSSKDSE